MRKQAPLSNLPQDFPYSTSQSCILLMTGLAKVISQGLTRSPSLLTQALVGNEWLSGVVLVAYFL